MYRLVREKSNHDFQSKNEKEREAENYTTAHNVSRSE